MSALCAGAVVAAGPASAVAAPRAGECRYPKQWDTLRSDVGYEVDLFSGQTQYDLSQVSAATATKFAIITIKRAQWMTNASSDIIVAMTLQTLSNPPRC